MSRFQAPCGHVGEPIIGTFVRCLQGCDSAKPVVGRRGKAGHVQDCACKACDVHRRATLVVLRTADGKDAARIPWDGIDVRPVGKATLTSAVRHWWMLDQHGAIIADGLLDASLVEGAVVINIDTFMDKLTTLSVSQAPEKWEFKYKSLHAPAVPGTHDDIVNVAKSVDGVREVEIRSEVVGQVVIAITHYRSRKGLLEDVVIAVKPRLAVGVGLQVFKDGVNDRIARVLEMGMKYLATGVLSEEEVPDFLLKVAREQVSSFGKDVVDSVRVIENHNSRSSAFMLRVTHNNWFHHVRRMYVVKP